MFKNILSALSGPSKNEPRDPAELLKAATQQKKEGDLDGALKSLREAYSEIAKGSMGYSAETFLRLPLYLQEAGRVDEAWTEFNKLLVDGYPNQMKDSTIRPMEHSVIYDKMRLFLEREGKRQAAVAYGIASHLSRASGLHLQERTKELEFYSSAESVSERVAKLLKKTGKESKASELVTLVENELKDPGKLNLPNVMRRVDEIVG